MQTTLAEPESPNGGSALADRIQHLMPAPDGDDDFIGVGGPGEGRRLLIVLFEESELRMDQPQSTFGARFRTLCTNRRRIRAPRHDPSHAQTPDKAKPLLTKPFFLDRLSEFLSGART